MDIRTLQKWMEDPNIKVGDRLRCLSGSTGRWRPTYTYEVVRHPDELGLHLTTDGKDVCKQSRLALFQKVS